VNKYAHVIHDAVDRLRHGYLHVSKYINLLISGHSLQIVVSTWSVSSKTLIFLKLLTASIFVSTNFFVQGLDMRFISGQWYATNQTLRWRQLRKLKRV
jgi:hypothetical protein